MKKAFPILKRGESALVTRRKHIPTWLFKQSVDLIKQQRAIEKAVSDIGMMNAGKKRDEILALVGPYFARLEGHLGQVKKYQATIDYLTQENEGLKEKVRDESGNKKQDVYKRQIQIRLIRAAPVMRFSLHNIWTCRGVTPHFSAAS